MASPAASRRSGDDSGYRSRDTGDDNYDHGSCAAAAANTDAGYVIGSGKDWEFLHR